MRYLIMVLCIITILSVTVLNICDSRPLEEKSNIEKPCIWLIIKKAPRRPMYPPTPPTTVNGTTAMPLSTGAAAPGPVTSTAPNPAAGAMNTTPQSVATTTTTSAPAPPAESPGETPAAETPAETPSEETPAAEEGS